MVKIYRELDFLDDKILQRDFYWFFFLPTSDYALYLLGEFFRTLFFQCVM